MTDLKKEIQDILHPENKKFHKMQEIAIERLHPPAIPGEKSSNGEVIGGNLDIPPGRAKTVDSEPGIDWDRIKQLSTFRRFIIDVVKIIDPMFAGVSTRKPKEIMDQELTERIKLAQDISKIARGSRLAMKECMKELKEVLKNRENKTF